MRISLKAINNKLERCGSQAVLSRGDGYFYFSGGEATDWLERAVRVPALHSLTLEKWIEQYSTKESCAAPRGGGSVVHRSGAI